MSSIALPHRRGRSRSGKQVVVVIALLVAAGVANSVYQLYRNQATLNSVALLRLDSTAEDAPLAAALVRDMAHALSVLPNVRITAPESSLRYQPEQKTVQQIGQELGVRGILRGKLAQSDGFIRLALQLVDTRNGGSVWEQQFIQPLEQLPELQANLANTAADKLRLHVVGYQRQLLQRVSPGSAAARREYALAMALLEQNHAAAQEQALGQLRQLARAEPHYAAAQSGLAVAAATLALEGERATPELLAEARTAAQQAAALPGRPADALLVLAALDAQQAKWRESGTQFQQAMQGEPGKARGPYWYARYWLLPTKRLREAAGALKRATDLNPLSAPVRLAMALPHFYAREYEKVRPECEHALRLDPDYEPARLLAERTDSQGARMLVPAQLPFGGLAGESLQAAQRKDPDAAFRLLQQAISANENATFTLAVEPLWDPLRQDPRWNTLLQQRGLPQK